jgi:hypothetical protein
VHGKTSPDDILDGEEDCRERIHPHDDLDGRADVVLDGGKVSTSIVTLPNATMSKNY